MCVMKREDADSLSWQKCYSALIKRRQELSLVFDSRIYLHSVQIPEEPRKVR